MVCEKISDQELVKKYLKGHELALQILIERHQEKVLGYIISKVKDRQLAEDLFQDVFIKVINTLRKGKYNEEGKFLPWVMRISHNLTIDYFRNAKKMKTTAGNKDFDIFDIIPDDEVNAEDKMAYANSLSKVKELIHHLPADQLQVLKMRMYYEMSFKEIADETNVSINTALGRMRYALMNLRKLVDENNISLHV
ncbi:sigma-70 family RNA polymerase sigma factor [bacterium SCSIO 12643]|nr:sigma-70 family RNA polymerase sigma factor [bacterium SCSIO 12643]